MPIEQLSPPRIKSPRKVEGPELARFLSDLTAVLDLMASQINRNLAQIEARLRAGGL